jgi:hypothetical protein
MSGKELPQCPYNKTFSRFKLLFIKRMPKGFIWCSLIVYERMFHAKQCSAVCHDVVARQSVIRRRAAPDAFMVTVTLLPVRTLPEEETSTFVERSRSILLLVSFSSFRLPADRRESAIRIRYKPASQLFTASCAFPPFIHNLAMPFIQTLA